MRTITSPAFLSGISTSIILGILPYLNTLTTFIQINTFKIKLAMYKQNKFEISPFSLQKKSSHIFVLELKNQNVGSRQMYNNPTGTDFVFRWNNHVVNAHTVILFGWINVFEILPNWPNCLREFVLPQDVDIEVFNQILKCIYGWKIDLSTEDLCKYLKVVAAIRVKQLEKQLLQQIMDKINQLNLFEVLEVAVTNNYHDLLAECCRILASQDFEQIRYEKYLLLGINKQSFKFILQYYKEKEVDEQIANEFITDLLSGYSKQHLLTQQDKSDLLNEILYEKQHLLFEETILRQSHQSNYLGSSTQPTINVNVIDFKKLKKDEQFQIRRSPSMSKSEAFKSEGKKKDRKYSNISSRSNGKSFDLVSIKEQQKSLRQSVQQIKFQTQQIKRLIELQNNLAKQTNQRLGRIETGMISLSKDLCLHDDRLANLEKKVADIEVKMMNQEVENDDSDEDEEESQEVAKKRKQLKISLTESRYIVC